MTLGSCDCIVGGDGYVILVMVSRVGTVCRVDVEVGGFFFCQAEDGIRYLVRFRGLGDVYKRQVYSFSSTSRIRQRVRIDPFGCPADDSGMGAGGNCLSLIHI